MTPSGTDPVPYPQVPEPQVVVSVNGEPVELATGTSIGALVQTRPPGGGRGVAVARNDALVPRSAWPTTMLLDGDRVELLVAAQGGCV